MMPENHEGSRIKQEMVLKKEKSRNHIKTFSCRASHYARRRAPGRPSDLNVKKIHEFFIEQNEIHVKYHLYYSIFIND